MRKKVILSLMAAVCFFSTIFANTPISASAAENELKKIKNVIIMIGDGMGPNQVKAGEIYREEPLSIQKIEQTTFSETCSYNNTVTDSAAGATALATGVRTNNSWVGISPSGKDLTTIMDIALEHGKRTGVLTTEGLYGATPMGFSAHYNNRDESAELLASAANSGVNLFVSTSTSTSTLSHFTDQTGNVYTKVSNVDDLSEAQDEYVIGGYAISATAPSMSVNANSVAFDRVVSEALEYLSKDPDGFVMMAEGAKIDKGGHNRDFNQMLTEMLAFDDAVKVAVDWAKNRDDTVVIVTADHETGGLMLNEGATKETLFDSYRWTTDGSHTSTDVFCKVYGVDVDFARYSSFGRADRIKNVDIFQMAQSFVSGKQSVTVANGKAYMIYGKISFDKEKYFYGDKLIITATPDEKCELTSLKINDVEMIKFVKDNVLEYEINSANVKVLATFKKAKTVYDISYENLGETGSYELNPASVAIGEKLVVKINVINGYEIETVTFNDVEMTKIDGNTYEIIPTDSGKVKAVFKAVEDSGNVEQNNNENVDTIEESKEKNGCNSSIVSVIAVLPIVFVVTALRKKKEN